MEASSTMMPRTTAVTVSQTKLCRKKECGRAQEASKQVRILAPFENFTSYAFAVEAVTANLFYRFQKILMALTH